MKGHYDQVQPNFNPEVGFVQRTDMTRYAGDVSWRPRPQNNRQIRNYIVGLGADYYTDEHGDPETREQRFNAGISFQDSSTLGFTATNTFDRLLVPFAIRSSVVIPVGDYAYKRYLVNFNSDHSRAISGAVNVGMGEFWNGDNRSVGGGLELKPTYHFNVDLTLSRSVVNLAAGSFSTTLVGTRLLWAFTSKAFLNSFLQYNATTNQFSSNTRFNVIHRPLSDLYVAYNEQRDTASGALLERGLIVKFTNMFDF